jgi:hypothetical protein
MIKINENTNISYDMALKAVLNGACDIPKIGIKICDLSFSDSVWAEINLKNHIISKFPLWALTSGYGSGDGSG